MSDLVGQRIGGYPIEKLLTKSSYTVLYQATTSAAPVAIRVVRDDLRGNTALNELIAKGWEDARAITHANLVATFSTGIDAQFGAFALQEVIRGKALRQFILEGSKVAWRDCLILAEQLAQAVQALHAGGKIHGDIWPSNIVVTQDQDVKLEGAGGITQLNCNVASVLSGPAAGYQPPECLNGAPAWTGSDIYGLGACIYFILAGRDAFAGDRADAVAKAVLERKLPPVTVMRDDLPPEADAFVSRLMSKDPAQRYGAIGDVLAEIERLKAGQPLGALKPGAPAPAAKFKPLGQAGQEAAVAAERPKKPETAGVPKPGGLSGEKKDAPGHTKVYGRLDTHVKSTIPQSETEKRGDDFYKQGQLPLALPAWREAYSHSPHTGLKIKIELAEKDLNREGYRVAMEEARLRLSTGDFKGAVSRAREAIISAEGDKERQQAVQLEQRAVAAEKDAAAKARQTQLIMAGIGVAVMIVLGVLILNRDPAETDPGPEPEVVENKGTVVPGPNNPDGRFVIPGANASIVRPNGWTSEASSGGTLAELKVLAPSKEVAALMKVSRLPAGTNLADQHERLRSAQNDLKEPSKIDDWDTKFFIDDAFRCSELGFRHMTDNGPALRYFYLVGGPENALYQVLFEGPENRFDHNLRGQMQAIVRSWTYKK